MDRGEIYHVDLNPVHGREQAGKRFVLVVSREQFNNFGTALVCPITLGGEYARLAGFTVPLNGAGTAVEGVILCNQARMVDLKNRGAKFTERVPDFIMDEVLAKLATLLD